MNGLDVARLALEHGASANPQLADAVPGRSLSDDADLVLRAGATPFIRGVIGWVDFEAPKSRLAMERLAAHPKLKGFRPMIQDLPDDPLSLAEPCLPSLRTASSTLWN